MKTHLSVLVLVKNEELNISNCLNSVIGVEEILIGDMGCSDNTITIAKDFNPRVVKIGDLGYAELGRNQLIEASNSTWLLFLDADERLSDNGISKIYEFIKSIPSDVGAVIIPRWHHLKELHFIASGLENHIGVPALVRRNAIGIWPRELHAPPQINGKIIQIDKELGVYIKHLWARDLEQLIEKLNRYTQFEALKNRDVRLTTAFDISLKSFFAHVDLKIDGPKSLVIGLYFFFYELVGYFKFMENNDLLDRIDLNEAQSIMDFFTYGNLNYKNPKIDDNLQKIFNELNEKDFQLKSKIREATNVFLALQDEKSSQKLKNTKTSHLIILIFKRMLSKINLKNLFLSLTKNRP